jgi:hypothetical protein
MNDIEKIKEKLAMKYMAGRLGEDDIRGLPIDDELRTFLCSLGSYYGSYYAYCYARDVDRKPTDETRTAACKDSRWAYYYAVDVDGEPTKETRTAAYKEPAWAYYYATRSRWKTNERNKKCCLQR